MKLSWNYFSTSLQLFFPHQVHSSASTESFQRENFHTVWEYFWSTCKKFKMFSYRQEFPGLNFIELTKNISENGEHLAKKSKTWKRLFAVITCFKMLGRQRLNLVIAKNKRIEGDENNDAPSLWSELFTKLFVSIHNNTLPETSNMKIAKCSGLFLSTSLCKCRTK